MFYNTMRKIIMISFSKKNFICCDFNLFDDSYLLDDIVTDNIEDDHDYLKKIYSKMKIQHSFEKILKESIKFLIFCEMIDSCFWK